MYTLKTFGTTTLPTADAEFTEGFVVPSGAMAVAGGGVYNGYGSENIQPTLPFTIRFRGLIYGASLTAVRTESDALRSLVGATAFLFRKARNNSDQHQVEARLISFSPVIKPPISLGNHEEVELQFLAFTRWESTTLSSPSVALAVGGGTTTIDLDNTDANRDQDDVILTLTAGSAAIATFRLDLGASSCSWIWTGTLAAGDSLVIDCGAMSVTNAGVDDYDALHLTANHKNAAWLELPKAVVSTATITWTDDSAGSTAAILTASFRKAYA